jgi:hypothetical protein
MTPVFAVAARSIKSVVGKTVRGVVLTQFEVDQDCVQGKMICVVDSGWVMFHTMSTLAHVLRGIWDGGMLVC